MERPDEDIVYACKALLEAANWLCNAHRQADDELYSQFYLAKVLQIRDIAEEILPPKEDWGGSNVVRFPIERRG